MRDVRFRAAAVVLLLFGVIAAGHTQPNDIRIVTPYAGWITNVYERKQSNGDLRLEDTDLMLGLYAQWIRPGSFQGNAFLYHAPDVNYAKLWGLHTNFDYYFSIGEIDNLVIGGGVELISIDIDAGDNVEDLQDFELKTTVVAPYLRTGTQIPFTGERSSLVIFPWVGAEVDFVRGDLSFVGQFAPLPAPSTFVETSLDDTDLYALAGINVRATLWRFLQIDAKYSGAFDPHTFLPRVSVMTNLFFTRAMGVSYRFSAMETSAGNTRYHIIGAAFVF